VAFLSTVEAEHEQLMQRCLQLARNGAGAVAPNPMVGAVLVHEGRILAEGWHKVFGGPHAEVECLRAFGDGEIPKGATLYVNLEPCTHHGKTPPCVDLIIARRIENLVVGCIDPNPQVQGKGIARARAAGIQVATGVCEAESRWLNRRFITLREQRRPYIVLKWAQSLDGLLDQRLRLTRASVRISSKATDVLVHQWRSEEQAILVGSRTAINDNPALNVRHVEGRSPLRVLIDRNNDVPVASKLFDKSIPTLLFTNSLRDDVPVEQVVMNNDADPITIVLNELQQRGIASVLVEGGAELLGHFLASGRWDEARVIRAPLTLRNGTPAPALSTPIARTVNSDADVVTFHTNHTTPDGAWHW
jgi:diaminohydroxyphosphoribosylaminopyrimidine deaminase / 5-amino-6-(5-phosphoribosylamino)uracil reductase